MKNQCFLFVFLFSFFSCAKKKTEFIHIETRVQTLDYEGHHDYYDVVFIINPPEKLEDIVKLIGDYNDSTIDKDKTINSFDYFNRTFYKESKRTPRDFQDNESFTPDRLYDNGIRQKIKRVDSTEVEWKLESYFNSAFQFEPIYYGHTCF
jgi:hypothetical protein